MKQITNKTILIQEIGQEKCKEYGCGNSECIFECLNPKKIFKTYQPVEVDGVVYWINDELTIQDVKPYYGKYHYEKGVAINIFPDYLTDLSECKLIIAQSQPRIEGIPVVSLDKSIDDFIYEYQQEGMLPSMAKRRILTLSNPNQYAQKDIEKAIELARETISSNEAGICDKYTELGIIQQINSISVIEVDEQFNIISYE
jgi:DNA-binding XRE family transcriptional regulator